eukprot:Phypoly_transcript_19354.p1 GENE.Phypoly_transcript_19354~~Phypoly_transcript_19354.p1  ORF type:complete len:107 (+),score=14.96 Phypoly_transcript_19354:217-537(+)
MFGQSHLNILLMSFKGMCWIGMVLERSMGIELPQEVLNSAHYKEIIELYEVVVATENDLVSLGKDISHNQSSANTIQPEILNHAPRFVHGNHAKTRRSTEGNRSRS